MSSRSTGENMCGIGVNSVFLSNINGQAFNSDIPKQWFLLPDLRTLLIGLQISFSVPSVQTSAFPNGGSFLRNSFRKSLWIKSHKSLTLQEITKPLIDVCKNLKKYEE